MGDFQEAGDRIAELRGTAFQAAFDELEFDMLLGVSDIGSIHCLSKDGVTWKVQVEGGEEGAKRIILEKA